MRRKFPASGEELLVAGLGQPHGADDSIGLVIADRLRSKGIPAISVTDATLLVDLLVVAQRAILIDAVVGAALPGSLVELSGEDLESLSSGRPVSTHGLSLAGAVAIARTLGGSADVRLVGISILPPKAASTELSPEVTASVPDAIARVLALCESFEDRD